MFLKISQNSQKGTCGKVPCLVILQAEKFLKIHKKTVAVIGFIKVIGRKKPRKIH